MIKIRKKFPIIRYCSSMIQQSHGESLDGHGFSLWDLKTKTYVHRNIPNDYGFFTVEVNKGKLITDLTNIPKKARLHVKCFESVASEIKEVITKVKASSTIDEVSYSRVDSDNNPNKLKSQSSVNLSDISDITYQNKLLINYLKDKCNITDQKIIESVLDVNVLVNSKIEKDHLVRNIRWKPKKFEFSNMFSYGEGNVIDFSKTKDVMGLFGPNTCGKSSLFSALSFCIFDKFDRGFKAKDVLNVQKTNFQCKFNFEVNGIDYFIERKGLSNRKGDVKVDVKFWKVENGKNVDLNGEARRNTNDIIKDIVGSYEDFILTSLSVQSGKNVASFIDMGQSERKDLLSQFIGLTIFDKLLEVATDESKTVAASLKLYKKDDHEFRLQNSSNELSILTNVLNDEISQLSGLVIEKNKLNEDIMTQMSYLKPINEKFMSIDLKKVNEDINLCETRVSCCQVDLVNLQEIICKGNIFIQKLNVKIKNLDDKNIGKSYKMYENSKNNLSVVSSKLELKKIDVENKVLRRDSLRNQDFDPNCKFCSKRNVSSVKELNKISTELEQDKIEVSSLLKNRNDAQLELDSLTWVVNAQIEYLKFLKEKNEESDILSKTNVKISSLLVEQQQNDSLKNSLKKDLEEYNTQLEVIESNRYTQTTIDQIKQNIRNFEFNINQKNKKIQDVNVKIEMLKNQVKQLTDSIIGYKKLEKEYEAYNFYIKSVNRDGIPFMVICNTVPEVEKEVNNILSQIAEFHLSIETDGKNITPYIVYDDRRWPIEMASGFEKFASSLAIRVALVNISNLPKINGIIIDEGFGVIDANNIPSIQTLFSFFKTVFDFIIIISHLDVLRDMVDHQIEIKKENGFSKVEFI